MATKSVNGYVPHEPVDAPRPMIIVGAGARAARLTAIPAPAVATYSVVFIALLFAAIGTLQGRGAAPGRTVA